MSSHGVELVNGVPVVGADQPGSENGAPRARARPQGDFFNTISHTAIAPPLDYSFQEIKNMSELAEHEPTGGGRKSAAKEAVPAAAASGAASADSKPAQSAASSTGVAGRRNPKALVTGLRLSYNELTSLKGFNEAVEAAMGPDAKTRLTWLDLSHNQLTSIDEVLLEYPNLTNLLLHGNQISLLSEVRKLSQLVSLQKLTLHGNPIYQPRQNHGLKNPRSAIIYNLRNCVLKSLDFITITDADRRNSLRWAEQNKPKKKRPVATGEDGEGSPVRR